MSFKVNLVNELTRMFKKKKTIVFIIINLVICGIASLIVSAINNNSNIHITNIWGNLHTIFFYIVLPLYIFIETLDLFTAETGTGLIKNVLVRPITRMKVYLSKVSAVGIFILFQIFSIIIFCAIISVIGNYAASTIVMGALSYIISFIPLIAFIFITAFIAQIVKNGLLGMLFCIFFSLICYATEIFFTSASAFVFTRHLKMYKMILTTNTHESGVVAALLIIGAYIMFSFTAGFLLFDKKEH